jgi:NADPH2:quinone reductase
MKAVIITHPGEPEVLQIAERPKPVCGPGEVMVKVMAAGVNRPDVAQRKGNYPPPAGAPNEIPGLEIAGLIDEVGPEVTRWKKGDKVCALVWGGGYAQYCNVPEGQCLPIPDNMTFIEAASLPETFFTVWSNLFMRGKLQPGESILIHGGSSGIGTTAIQMAKAMGSTVYVTAGNDEKCRFCEKLGADKAINYNTENFAERINQLTGGNGVNVILDMIGGEYFKGNVDSLAIEGRLVLINVMKGKTAEIELSAVMRKRIFITGSMLRGRDVSFKAEVARQLEQHIWPLISAGKIKACIHAVFPAEKAADAHRMLESSAHMGKIVLSFEV